MQTNLKVIVISLTAGILIFTGYLASFHYFKPTPELVFCTQDAKLCPNGSYVGRTGPKCEFAQCPNIGTSDVQKFDVFGWKTYRIDEDGYSISLPRGWSMPNTGNFYGPGADLASISVVYYAGLKDIPLNEVTGKPYVSFEQYVADQNLFKDQNISSFNFGIATKAISAEDPFYKVLLIKGNNHFYEIIYAARYNQTLSLLDQILSTFKFLK